KGTNNRERLTGSRAFIKKLSQLNGTGAVTTHDLELVNLSDEITSITNYHFREDIIDSKMVFDYKIHNGPCPTTNALKIMELSGLPVD
ncbi:MAG: DNA mismatch repair protein, partial [Ignavibacteria bacterium]